MILLQEPRLSEFSPCTYLPGLMWRFEYFFARELEGGDLDQLLSRGWRKFGEYYFRPDCAVCRRCIPLRLIAGEFKPSKNQRRVARKCSEIQVRFTELEYRDEIFEIYRDHSWSRFGKESEVEDFVNAFYPRSCPGLQSEYYLDGMLIAVGFIDVSDEAMSSVYFVYKSSFEQYRLGTYSVVRETEYARSRGLKYYYLGYYIEENKSMSYKGHFHPHEIFDWEVQMWKRENIS
jgi:leucyl-tRNA---protein transferase